MTAAAVLLQSLGNGTLQTSTGAAINGHQVYVYQRGTTTQVQVYSDNALTIPLTQPLTTGSSGANPGGIPGYVLGGQPIDFYDATAGLRQPAEPESTYSVVLGGPSGPPAWAASTLYEVNQLVTQGGAVYINNVTHTSAGSWGSDSSNWTAFGAVGSSIPSSGMIGELLSNSASGAVQWAPTYVILPSGDTSGATDTTNLNTALATGAYVRGTPGTYYLNAPLYLYSGSTLDMTGCTITLKSGLSPVNMIRNHAVDAGRSVSDGIATSGSATLQSATANFTSGDIGSAVEIKQAGYATPSPSTKTLSWYGTITAVADSSHCTVSVNAQQSGSSLTVKIYPNRDHDIKLIGGFWNPPDLSAGTDPLTQFITCFRRVDRMTVRDMTFQMAGTRGLGGRYALSFGDVTNLTVNNINFPSVSGDGVHVWGPAARVSISDIYGNTGDDFVSVAPVDAFSNTVLVDVEGAMSDVVIERLYPSGAATIANVYTSDTSGYFPMNNVTVRDAFSMTACTGYGVWVNAGPGSISGGCVQDNITVENIAVPVPTGSYGAQWGMVTISNPQATNVTVRNVDWTSSTVVPGDGIVYVTACGDNLLIENIRLTGTPTGSSPVPTGILFKGNSSLSSNTAVGSGVAFGSVTIRGIHAPGAPSYFYAIVTDTVGTIGDLSISDVKLAGSNWILLDVSTSSTTITNGVNIANCVLNGILYGVDTASAITVRASNVYFGGTNFVYGVTASKKQTVHLANCDFNTTSAVVYPNSTGAGSRLACSNCTQAGAGTAIYWSGSGTAPSLNGTTLGVDLSTLTPTDGDMVYNTNASLTCNVGVCVYNSAAGHWKNIYTENTA